MTHAEAMTIASFLRSGRHYRSRHHARGLSELWFDKQHAHFVLTTSRHELGQDAPVETRLHFSSPALHDWLMRSHVYEKVVQCLYQPVPGHGKKRWMGSSG